MHRLIDKLALVLLSSIALFTLNGLVKPVLLLLISVILSELIYITPNKSKPVPVIAYGVLTLFLPASSIMLPLFVYDTLWLRKYPILIICMAGFLLSVPSLSALQIAFVLVGAGLAVLLQYRTSNAETLQKRLTMQRDESEEVRILLSEKNKNLIDKQDSEIYIWQPLKNETASPVRYTIM